MHNIIDELLADGFLCATDPRTQKLRDMLEVVQAMAQFDGRCNNAALKAMARAALAEAKGGAAPLSTDDPDYTLNIKRKTLEAAAPDMLAALHTSDRAHAAMIHWTLKMPPHLQPPKNIVNVAREASRDIEAVLAKVKGGAA